MQEFYRLKQGLIEGSIVPVLGPGALDGASDRETGAPVPADNRSLILAMNNGREMMPRLMYEFSRAAQQVEQRRGQAAVTRFLRQLYSRPSTLPPLYPLLTQLALPYVIDLNRDGLLQQAWAERPHTLVQGASRIMGQGRRYRLFAFNDGGYQAIEEEAVDTTLPVLFKPLGCPLPEAGFIASDADFVDYLTELMGGFAIPSFLKRYRERRRYLLLGLPLNRDTERMLVSELTFGADPLRGWVILGREPTAKETKFCQRLNLEILPCGVPAFSDWLQESAASGVA
ncbi:hypothetical protein [Motiliproteus sp. SC1-56]|uniref:hypothetical protein n=1 Tax=Motiliproteus sp. SC1-56 TaxID=2799565 RepID=UPI001A8D0A0F|nr:hypothetical protein [Motiliproteus sp. SC1-56]